MSYQICVGCGNTKCTCPKPEAPTDLEHFVEMIAGTAPEYEPAKDSAREFLLIPGEADEPWVCREVNQLITIPGTAEVHVIEYAAYEKLERELAELKAKPATFIKMDETTEAFVQTRAAIENMKQFQRDAIQARAELAEAKAEVVAETIKSAIGLKPSRPSEDVIETEMD